MTVFVLRIGGLELNKEAYLSKIGTDSSSKNCDWKLKYLYISLSKVFEYLSSETFF